MQNQKCVIILDESLPTGLLANTSAILGITLGKKMPQIVGQDVQDANHCIHAGIIQFPIPILKADTETLALIRKKLDAPEYSELTTVDFSETAQSCNTYNEFIEKMKCTSMLQYMGILLCGDKKLISKMTGNLPLLR